MANCAKYFVLYALIKTCYSVCTANCQIQTYNTKPDSFYIPESFISREDWGAAPWKTTKCPRPNDKIKQITIHHTAGKQSTDIEKSKATIKQIQSGHQNTRKWPDIGYHFLIDSGGNVLQGRPFYDDNDKSFQKPTLKPAKDPKHTWPTPRFIRGTHVTNHNQNNIGISVMGCYAPKQKNKNDKNGCPAYAVSTIQRYDKTYTNLVQLISYLVKYLSLNLQVGDTITTHQSFNKKHTVCPGHIHDLIGDIRVDVKATIQGNGLCVDYNGSGGSGRCAAECKDDASVIEVANKQCQPTKQICCKIVGGPEPVTLVTPKTYKSSPKSRKVVQKGSYVTLKKKKSEKKSATKLVGTDGKKDGKLKDATPKRKKISMKRRRKKKEKSKKKRKKGKFLNGVSRMLGIKKKPKKKSNADDGYYDMYNEYDAYDEYDNEYEDETFNEEQSVLLIVGSTMVGVICLLCCCVVMMLFGGICGNVWENKMNVLKRDERSYQVVDDSDIEIN